MMKRRGFNGAGLLLWLPLLGMQAGCVRAEDAVELFFLQIQGSGQLALPSGERLRLGYGDHNGHPYRSLGRALIQRGELTLEQTSMQGLKAWAAANPQKLREALAGVALTAPRVPVIANVTAQPHGTPASITDTLVAQVTGSVRWEESIRHLLAQGFTRFIELGPGTALTGFLKRIDKSAQVLNVADCASLEATVKALGT